MIKNWSKFNESFKRGEKINAMIELLKELSLELTDIGLSVEIWNGTWKDNGMSTLNRDGYDLPSKSIIMFIKDKNDVLDEDSYYENELKDKPEINEFEQTLLSFGFKPVYKSGAWDRLF